MTQLKSNNPLIFGASIEKAGIGGVTIHVQRLIQWLCKYNYAIDFCDYKNCSLLRQFTLIAKHRVVHLHVSRPLPRLIFILFCRLVGTKSILTVHGSVGRFSLFKNLMDQLSIRFCNVPIMINATSFHRALRWNKNSKLQSVFLPPVDEGYLPDHVYKMIEEVRKRKVTIVSVNASVMSYTDAGEEIYGLSFVINFFRDKLDYFLCVSDPSGQYANKYKNESFDNILFIKEHHSFYKLLMLSDIMLRPTATDGDALSVKEGLYLRKKVIATDRVDRPSGVILFKYNDSKSLSEALSCKISYNDTLSKEHVVKDLIEVYNHLKKK